VAIVKNYQTTYGVIANYHKLVKTEIFSDEQHMMLIFAVYYTKEARDSGATPVWHEYVKIPFDIFTVDPRQTLYNIAQTYESSYIYGGTTDTAEQIDLTQRFVIKPEYTDGI
jgi:hypothetical protein